MCVYVCVYVCIYICSVRDFVEGYDGIRADKGHPRGAEEHQRSVYRFGG